jgi:uncharacterized membrane protein (DUF4010 family)
LLISPFLPNKDYGLYKLLNPVEIGSNIVIVSFLNFIGYFSVKFLGSKKGVILTEIFGGFISSTTVAWNCTSRIRGKESSELVKKYYARIIVASAIMCPRLALVASIFNNTILEYVVLPFGLLTLVCSIVTLVLMRRDDNKPDTDIKSGNAFNMLNAISFGVVYIFILFAVFYSNQFCG